jgi:RNA polymerase subunit RPABC4/transcription elongation factor Spt4
VQQFLCCGRKPNDYEKSAVTKNQNNEAEAIDPIPDFAFQRNIFMEAIQGFLTNLRPILSLLGIIVGAYLLLLWAASVLWAYRDIRSRSEDVSVQVLAVGLVLLLPFGGILLHLILRPAQTLAEKYEWTLEEEYLRRDIEERYVCPECQRAIEPDFVMCPHCHSQLRRRCQSCDRVIDLTWSICPYCGNGGSAAIRMGSAPLPAYRPATQPHSTEEVTR